MDIDGTTIDGGFNENIQPGCQEFLNTLSEMGIKIVYLTFRGIESASVTKNLFSQVMTMLFIYITISVQY